MAKPEAIAGSLMDPVVSNDLGALNTLIGFVGNAATGATTGPEGQTAAIHRIGHVDTDAPSVVGYEEPETP